ncbi:MAG: putative ABC transporter permease subunit [Desulfosudaceae bacterium]
MRSMVTRLLSPRVLSFKNSILTSGKTRLLLFGGIGAALWTGVFAAAFQVLAYLKSIEDLGDILAVRLLSMIFVVILALLLFSSIITTLSKLYLSRDLNLVHSLPVPARFIFLARWLESTVDSAWMVVVFVLPVFFSYGLVFRPGPLYYPATGFALVLLCGIASALSALVIALIVNLISASRLKTIFVFLGFVLFIILYLAFRMIRPERLVDPEMFATTLSYLNSLQAPDAPWLPSTCCLLNGAICLSFAAMVVLLMLIAADKVYFSGFSKTAGGPARSQRRPFRPGRGRLPEVLPGPVRAYVVKEVKVFVRDQTQWSQVFLIFALIIIYVYNFKVLPLDKAPIPTIYLQNLLAFLNMGLAAFVLTAVTARFAFTAVSMEKGAFWITRSAPISAGAFLRIKFLVYLTPLFALTMFLIVVTNLFLRVTPFMMVLSLATMILMIPAIVAMGVGLGAAWPDFASENPAQAVTSFGGFVFMTASALYVLAVIGLEAGPTFHLFLADLGSRQLTRTDWIWMGGAFGGVIALSIFTTVFSLAFGARRLWARDGL